MSLKKLFLITFFVPALVTGVIHCRNKEARKNNITVTHIALSIQSEENIEISTPSEESLKNYFIAQLVQGGVLFERPHTPHEGEELRVEIAIAKEGKDTDPQVTDLRLSTSVSGKRLQATGDLQTIDTQIVTTVAIHHLTEKRLLQVLERVLVELAKDVIYQGSLWTSSEAQVAKQINEKNPQVLAALQIVALRQVRSAMPQVIKLLKNKDQDIADSAIGTLVALKDQRSVKALTEVASFGDTESLAKVLDAIAAIGGPKAREYLEFVAVGHEDEDIRNIAKEALSRMDGK